VTSRSGTTSSEMISHDQRRAQSLLEDFLLVDAVYLLGSLERGVTVYGQQVRAHNLLWALWETERHKPSQCKSIAIVGGGIGGLTAAACATVMFSGAHVTVFEKSLDLAAIQQASDTRWLHPRIYQWPDYGSRAPSASLPVLNWSEGRASDVAHQILKAFGNYVSPTLSINVGVEHLRINAASRSIDWVGRRAKPKGEFVNAGSSAGTESAFDLIIVAAGFGLERTDDSYPTPSYWHNDLLSQPALAGGQRTYVISGFGDGAIVDLCRITIERFRQDRILYDLFGERLEEAEAELRKTCRDAESSRNASEHFRRIEHSVLAGPKRELRRRVRKDTKAVLHLTGNSKSNNTLQTVFDHGRSSFANRMLLFLLYRCGAFIPRFGRLEDVVKEYSVPPGQVLCRFGPNPRRHVEALFDSSDELAARLDELHDKQPQSIDRQWTVGSIPNMER
jgi:hypothetical protein